MIIVKLSLRISGSAPAITSIKESSGSLSSLLSVSVSFPFVVTSFQCLSIVISCNPLSITQVYTHSCTIHSFLSSVPFYFTPHYLLQEKHLFVTGLDSYKIAIIVNRWMLELGHKERQESRDESENERPEIL